MKGGRHRQPASVLPMVWPWVILGIVLAIAVVLEALSFVKPELSLRQAIVVNLFYLVAGALFCLVFAGLYHQGLLGAERTDTVGEVMDSGGRTLTELLEGLLIGKLVLFENVFVLYLVFKSTGISPHRRRWPLMVGVFALQILRMVFVATQVLVVGYLSWAYYLLAVYLVVAAIHLLPEDGEDETSFFVEGLLTRLHVALKRVVPDEPEMDGGPPPTARWVLLIVGMLVVDAVFAFNSAPVMLGVSPEPFVVIAATGLSLAGTRALFSIVVHLGGRLWPLRPYVAVVLLLIAAHMLLGNVVPVPEPWPLVILGVVLAVGIWRTIVTPVPAWRRAKAMGRGAGVADASEEG
jgi:tellurite resistance protein TerC